MRPAGQGGCRDRSEISLLLLILILQMAIAFVLLSAVSALPWEAKFEQSVGMQVSVGAVIAIYAAMWFATHAKRWHDLGRSGWSTLICSFQWSGHCIY
jgi:uncharacterized membrane protein YhaH (DUF805 family)